MAVSVTTNRIPFAGDGSTTAFTIPFKWLDNADLSVIYTPSGGSPVAWVVGADFTLVGVGVDAGGTLTATTAPAASSTLVVTRSTPPKQPLSLPAQGPFPAASIEGALDRAAMAQQDAPGDATTAVDALALRVTALESAFNAISGGSFSAQQTLITALQHQVALNNALNVQSVSPGTDAGAFCFTGFSPSASSNEPVAAVYGDVDGGIFSSTNVAAGTWTSRTSNLGANPVRCIASNGVLLVAVADGGKLSTSADGVTWTNRTGLGSGDLQWVVWSATLSLWCLVDNAGAVYTSSNGTSWTLRTSGYAHFLSKVVFGNGIFLAITGSAGRTDYITSANGTAWATRTFPATVASGPGSLHFSSTLGLFFICATTGIYSSPDGVAWTLRLTFPKSGTVWNIGGTSSILVAADASGYVVTSFDGITWTRREVANLGIGLGPIFGSASGEILYMNYFGSPQTYSATCYTP